MAFKLKDCANPQPESGQGSQTQESGDERFSADLIHRFIENYDEILSNSEPKSEPNSQPKEHSSVKLILNEKIEMIVLPLKNDKVPHSECFETESQKVSSEEGVVSLDVSQNPISSPNTQSVQENEAVINMGEENAKEDDCLNMEDRKYPAEGEAKNPEKGRNGIQNPKKPKTTNRCTTFARRHKKKVLLGFGLTAVIAVIIVVGFVAHAQQQNPGSENTQLNYCKGNCFTCMDEGKCLNMTAIFRDHDAEYPIYQKNTQAFPKCSEMVTPEDDNCVVCFDRDDIRICCSKNVIEIMAEETSGNVIENISKECTGRF